jgi:putative transposase
MSTYTQLLYQFVFSTKNREKTILLENKEALFRNINSTLKNKNCRPFRINGMQDHIHIVLKVHPSLSISNLIKDIKLSSSDYIKRDGFFPGFNGWQNGYGAFSYSIKELDNLITYVKNQEIHHQDLTFKEEYIQMLNDYGIEFDKKYLF